MKRARALLIVLAVVSILAITLTGVAAAPISVEAEIVQATGITRTVSATLQVSAQSRAAQIVTDFDHCCLAVGEAEVIGWSRGHDDPVAAIVTAWIDSPTHEAILRDPDYTSIGCAHLVTDDPANAGEDETHYFVCRLSRATPFAPGPSTVPLPNTAMEQ